MFGLACSDRESLLKLSSILVSVLGMEKPFICWLWEITQCVLAFHPSGDSDRVSSKYVGSSARELRTKDRVYLSRHHINARSGRQ